MLGLSSFSACDGSRKTKRKRREKSEGRVTFMRKNKKAVFI
jgi:hypothetical protein